MKNIRKKVILIIFLMLSAVSISAMGENQETQPRVVRRFFEEAQKNSNWKTAFATAKHEQIVFMTISPSTNPNNEIGSETHPFDQVILIVEGKARVVLNKKISYANQGDMIFIPQGTVHNVINLNKDKELKIISFYSENDIPKGAIYQKKSNEPAEQE